MTYKSGFVGLLGLPNVGKSTLINRIIGSRVSIVTPVPQTTRNLIRGVYSRSRGQIIFVDTPGFHRDKHKHKFNKHLNAIIDNMIADVDVILLILSGRHTHNQLLLKQLQRASCPVVLVGNKRDILGKGLDALLKAHKPLFPFAAVHAISARTGYGVPDLIERLFSLLPQGPQYFPADFTSDRSDVFHIAELIRAQLFLRLKKEMPHKVAVVVEHLSMAKDRKKTLIMASIWVEKKNEKPIIIGKKGAFLKAVGSAAREQIEQRLQCPVFLSLFVKIKKDWRNDPKLYETIENQSPDFY